MTDIPLILFFTASNLIIYTENLLQISHELRHFQSQVNYSIHKPFEYTNNLLSEMKNHIIPHPTLLTGK